MVATTSGFIAGSASLATSDADGKVEVHSVDAHGGMVGDTEGREHSDSLIWGKGGLLCGPT